THMLKGLDVAPNPLAQKRHTAEPRVLYADEYIMVVDKPAGMLSVPGKAESVRSEFSDSANISVEEYFANLQLPTNSQFTTEQFTIGEADNSKLKIQKSKLLRKSHNITITTPQHHTIKIKEHENHYIWRIRHRLPPRTTALARTRGHRGYGHRRGALLTYRF
ncbi:MAG: hypothetical protein MSS89_06730, partial [Prevotella sp.]|nr:hypothetical protein [Prevotella sp.]